MATVTPCWRYSTARSAASAAGGARPGLRVGRDVKVVVALVAVDAGAMHAHVGEEATDQERVDAQAAEQEVQVGGEGAVAAFLDEPLAGAGSGLRSQLDAGGALHAVQRLVAVELAAEVDELPRAWRGRFAGGGARWNPNLPEHSRVGDEPSAPSAHSEKAQ